MKISPISFKNNYKLLGKTTNLQTRPISLKADSVEFSKNISFKANLTSEEEIYEIDKQAIALSRFILSEMPDELETAQCELEQAEDVWEYDVQPTLKNEDVVFYTKSDIFGDSIKGFVEKNDDKTYIKEYKNGDLCTETIKDKTSITYRNYAGRDNNEYDEWIFALDGELKSVSRGISEKYGVKETYSKRTFVNGKLCSLQRGIKEEGGRSKKIGSELELIDGKALSYCEGITISQKDITHVKEKINFIKNNMLSSFIQDEVSGKDWSTSAHEIIYTDGVIIAQYRKGKFSSLDGNEGDEQLSWFQDGKLYTTRGQGY